VAVGLGWRAAAPAALLAVGLAGAAGTALMQRRGLLAPARAESA
jgi:hypothetical protein